jgi:hypothetical protein
MTQNKNGVVTNGQENLQLFSEGSLMGVDIVHYKKVLFAMKQVKSRKGHASDLKATFS